VCDTTDGVSTEFKHGVTSWDKDGMPNQIPAKLKMNVNFNDAEIIAGLPYLERFFGISECLGVRGKIGNIDIYKIARVRSPFYVTIAHELIHLKHFLDTCLNRKASFPYGKAIGIQDYPHLKSIDIHLPETEERGISSKLRREIPWTNYEERRTVVGPDIDGISELSFRIVAGLPIRYLYQGPYNCFCEDADIRVLGKIVRKYTLRNFI